MNNERYQILRKKATDILLKNHSEKTKEDNDLVDIIQEIQVYQKELEIQNEELIVSQNELAKTQNEYLQLFEFAPCGYVQLSLKGTVEKINLVACNYFENSRNYLINYPFTCLLDNNYLVDYNIALRRSSKENVKSTLEVEIIKKKSKETMWVQLDILPKIDLFSDLKSFLITIIDISDRKKLEFDLIKEQIISEKANKSKSEFLSNMSHEIRTPLNGIIGFTELLNNIEKDKEKASYLKIIDTCSCQLLEIINSILSFSKIEAGKYLIKKEEHNFCDFINCFIQPHKELILQKKLEFNFSCNTNLDKTFSFDKNAISQILNNLLSNSLKFTDSGEIVLDIKKIEIFSSDNTVIQIIIKDTGIGVEKDKIEKLFEPFEQGEYYLSKAHGGTGLGLAIVKDLVTLLEGTIEVNSKVNTGTEFEILIPIKEVHSIEKKPIEAKKELNLTNKKIIIAEDIQSNILLYKNFLKDSNCILKVVENGQELIEEVNKEKYDIILLDIQMPIIDGIEATRIIRNELKLKDIIIIGISAYVFNDNIKKALESGMNDYLSKPFVANDLLECIKINLDKKD